MVLPLMVETKVQLFLMELMIMLTAVLYLMHLMVQLTEQSKYGLWTHQLMIIPYLQVIQDMGMTLHLIPPVMEDYLCLLLEDPNLIIEAYLCGQIH